MASPTPAATGDATVEQLLATELVGARHLLAVLRAEQAALADHDAAAIERILADKREALQALQQLAARRTAVVPNAELPAPHAGWRELEHTLAELRRQNEINGGLVQRRLQHAGRALAILRGQTDPPDLYRPNGALAVAPAVSRAIVSA
jgi:flagellar biosynthesis/type III secretory pathway chaperone